MRTVIFGADGLAFRIIHPLLERGELPNFRKLQEQGCEATLDFTLDGLETCSSRRL
jgi:hypothetical protein